jgi:hypothetical protein
MHVKGSALCLSACLSLSLALAGCFDRGGLDNDDGGGNPGSGGQTGSGGSGNPSGSGGQVTTGSGGRAAGSGGQVTTGSGGRTASTGGQVTTGSGGRMTGSGGRVGMGTGGAFMCPGICDIFCPYGNEIGADGCPLCRCKPGPNCGAALPCPALCPYGFALDANGCATCTCNPPPMCEPLNCPLAPCTYGLMKDEKGCDICKCNPATCTPEECGTPPPSTGLVYCPAPAGDPTGPATGSGSSGSGASSGSGSGPSPGGGSGAAPPADIAAPIPQPVCQRDPSTGKCVWVNPRCGTACTTIACTLACPNGFQMDTRGCPICACKPAPATCASYSDYRTCVANMECRWLQPGCGDPALAAGGCYARTSVDCVSDAQCGAGRQCLKRVINPCYMSSCAACGQTVAVCQ